MASPFPANIPPADATAFLRDKLALPTETWTDIWKGAHARAFVVAGANKEAIVTDFQVTITKMIEEGRTLADFEKEFDRVVKTHGWSHTGSRGWRARVIFETNTRQAYMAAKWKTFVENRLMRPFLRYIGVLDDKIRPTHRAWHDTVLPVEHPWWHTHFPMNGWGCRCDVQSLSQRDLDRRGFRVQPEAPPIVMVSRPVISKSGKTFVNVPKGIDPGFDYNVGRAGFGAPSAKSHSFKTLASPIQSPPPANLPPVATSTLPLENIPSTEEAIRQALRDVLGGETAAFTDPTDAVVSIGQAIVDHLLEKEPEHWKRSAYLPFLPELIQEPQEIWLGFAENEVTGRVEMRRRYVRYVEVRKGKLLSLVTDVRGRELIGFTFFVGSKPTDPAMRTGLLLYRMM